MDSVSSRCGDVWGGRRGAAVLSDPAMLWDVILHDLSVSAPFSRNDPAFLKKFFFLLLKKS